MSDDVSTALSALSDALGGLGFGLLSAGRREAALHRRDRVRHDVEGHLGRLLHPDAPLLVVVGGVTGGGKSTIVNTLVRRAATATGVRRPTTSTPTLLCHPQDVGWFTDDRLLPSLPRRHELRARRAGDATDGARLLELVDLPAVPRGLALLDAPDSDSVSARNRELAGLLLDAADVWLWVTSQGKYADEDSMAQMRRARERGAALATALTLVDPEHLDILVEDYTTKLADEGLTEVTTFAVPRSRVVDEQLPEHAVQDLRAWLWSLADLDRRRSLREQTLRGALAALPSEADELLSAFDTEQRTYQLLTSGAMDQYRAAARQFEDLLDQGQISLREQVLRSWVDFIGTGRFQRFIRAAPELLRSAGRQVLAPMVRAKEERLRQELEVEAADAVANRVRQVADMAAGDTAQGWLADPVGRELLEEHPGLQRSSTELDGRVARAASEWEEELREMVETRGSVRRVRAQWASTAINATAASLMIAVFASTGGASALTGVEVTIAGAGATVGQLVLEKMIGTQNVRWLVAEAKRRLVQRVEAVLDDERSRFAAVAAERAPDPAERARVVAALGQLRRGLA